jgi:hypothetical protein
MQKLKTPSLLHTHASLSPMPQIEELTLWMLAVAGAVVADGIAADATDGGLLLLETVVVAKLVEDDTVEDDIAVADVVAAGASPSSLELEAAAVEVWSSGLPLRLLLHLLR